MIGTLQLSDSIQAVLEDGGVWSCPHAGFQAELNALHRPKSESPDFTLPFGVSAVTGAARAYGVPFELAAPVEPSPEVIVDADLTSEEVGELMREVMHALDFEEITAEEAKEIRGVLDGLASKNLKKGAKRMRAYLAQRRALRP